MDLVGFLRLYIKLGFRRAVKKDLSILMILRYLTKAMCLNLM
jgi:hypothetical protein